MGRGGRLGGGGQLGISAAWGGVPKVGGGGACAIHYYYMHTSTGDACLGVWGYGGMYAIIALSCHCREESLKGRRVAPLPPSPSPLPLPPPPLFPRAPRLVCEKNSWGLVRVGGEKKKWMDFCLEVLEKLPL